MRAACAIAVAALTSSCLDPAKVLSSYCRANPAVCSPTNVVAPAIAGIPEAGHLLTVDGGEWRGEAELVLEARWSRCTADEQTCSLVSAAASPSYRVTEEDIGFRLRADVTATNPHGTSSAATAPTAVVTAGVPVGAIVATGASSLPAGWVWADGQALSRTGYPELFAVLGTRFGGDAAAGTFLVPDLRERLALGRTDDGPTATIGATGGQLHHTHTAEVAPHGHSVTVAGHAHTTAQLVTHSHGISAFTQKAASGSGSAIDNSFAYDVDSVRLGSLTSTTTAAQTLETSEDARTVALAPADPPYLVVRHAIRATSDAAPPCGGIWWGAMPVAPPKTLLANGADLDRSVESALFECLSTTFGAGAGSSSFLLPDLRGRFAIGDSPALPLGSSGGAAEHTHAINAPPATHTVALPAHGHSVTPPTHAHNISNSYLLVGVGCATTGVGVAQSLATVTAGGGAAVTESEPVSAILATVSSAPALSGASSSAEAPFAELAAFVWRSPDHPSATGTIVAFAGLAPPRGWLVADGAAVSRETHAALFAAIGTTYGAGDGATTFNLPDLRGRAPRGVATLAQGTTLGATGGTLGHVHGFTLPPHDHELAAQPHGHEWKIPAHSHSISTTKSCSVGEGAQPPMAALGVATTSGGDTTVASASGEHPAATTTMAAEQVITTAPADPAYLVISYVIKE